MGGINGSPVSPGSDAILRTCRHPSDTMTDENTPTVEPPKSASDLAIEQLQQRLDAMESSYKQQISELEAANKSLWAAAHKAPEQDTEPESPRGFDFDKAEKAFFSTLGRKDE